MEELNDDLILEIVKRLPLKHRLQCSLLNKNICHWIFQPYNLFPSYSTIVHRSTGTTLTSISDEIRSAGENPLRRSVALGMDFSIVASCNGILLIEIGYSNPSYIVFNPTTSQIAVVDDRIDYSTAGLAVPDNSPLKLVDITRSKTSNGIILEFRVFAPSVGSTESTLVVKSLVDYESGRVFKLMKDFLSGPVYAHGSLYWIGDDRAVTVAFDVEKEEARLIDGPLQRTVPHRTHRTTYSWIGFAKNAVHFFVSSRTELVIRRYDHLNDKWGATQRITDIWTSKGNGLLMFFDGRWLLCYMGQSSGGTCVDRYDFENNVWEEYDIGSVYEWTCGSYLFYPYTSTFVKVSDTYLDDKNTSLWEDEGRRNALLELQKLLRPYKIQC